MNFRRGHASPEPLSNLQAVTQASKLPENRKKDESFCENVEILGGVTRKFGCCRNVKLVNWVTRHTPCRMKNLSILKKPWELRTRGNEGPRNKKYWKSNQLELVTHQSYID
jgi:hypothetical protein